MLDDGRRSAVTWAMTLLNDGRRSLSVMDVGHKWSMPQDVLRPPGPLLPKPVPPPREVDGVMRKSRLADAEDDVNGTSHRQGAGGVVVDDEEYRRFSPAAGELPVLGDGNRLHDRRSLTVDTAKEPYPPPPIPLPMPPQPYPPNVGAAHDIRRSATAAAAAAPTVIGNMDRLVRAGPHSCCTSDLISAADLALRGRSAINVQWPDTGGPHAPGSAPPPANMEFCRGRICSARCVGPIVWNIADGSKQLFTLNLENEVRCWNKTKIEFVIIVYLKKKKMYPHNFITCVLLQLRQYLIML